jgi:hypothetical protein
LRARTPGIRIYGEWRTGCAGINALQCFTGVSNGDTPERVVEGKHAHHVVLKLRNTPSLPGRTRLEIKHWHGPRLQIALWALYNPCKDHEIHSPFGR